MSIEPGSSNTLSSDTGTKKKDGTKKYVAIAILAVVIAVVVAWFLLGGFSGISGKGVGSSSPLRVEVVEVKEVAGIKIPTAESGNTKFYNVYYPEPGYKGYLIKIRVSNNGDETYGIAFRLIADNGEQVDILGNTMLGFSGGSLQTVPSDVLEKAIEINPDMLYGYGGLKTFIISPGASEEIYLFYGVPQNSKPAELHVIAKGAVSGKIIEFNIKIP